MRKIQNQMERLILSRAKEIDGGYHVGHPIVIDGLTNPSLYQKAPVKIMFVGKESYSTEDDKDEILYHTKYLNDTDPYILDRKDYPAHWTISKIVSGIYHNWLFRNPKYDEIWGSKYKKDYSQILQEFESIAWVNIGKYPAPGGSRTTPARLDEVYEQWKDVLYNQIEAYDPDIIIFGGTFGPIENDVECEYTQGLKYLFKEGVLRAFNDAQDRLVIATYHPSQYRISKEQYVNSIIHACRRADFKNKKIGE